jgi:pyrroline-5-carboxylate reductase
MQIGFIGAGNMARAMARGWAVPLVCADPDTARAAALAAEVAGSAVASNAEVASQSDITFLCHKPTQLQQVAAEIAPSVKVVVSILGGVPLSDLRAAYPDREVYRALPSTPVELRQGVVLLAEDDAGGQAQPQVRDLLAQLGTLVELPERMIDPAMNLMSCAPAYMALVAEAQIDAGVRRGLPPELATEMVIETMAGTASLLRHQGGDTRAVRSAVTSPGGSTARGLAALERGGIRAAFADAIDAVLDA